MTLRIAQVSATFPPYRGGTGNVCYHNARELARRGHEVHVFTAAVAGASAREEREGMMIHRLRPLVRVGNAPVLPGLIRALGGFDIVHLHYPFFGGELTALAAALHRTPLVITYHQDVLLHGPMGLIAEALRWTTGLLTIRSASRLLFTSLDYGRSSHAGPMLYRRAHRIDELSNGVDCGVFSPCSDRPSLRARYGIARDERVVLLVAGLDRAHFFKGVDVLLDAMAQLPASVKGIIVGDGDMRAGYAARAEQLGLGQRIIFAGRVSDQRLPQYYQLADVTVLPSTTMGEAFGLVLVESLACATPVIATNLPGVRTVVQHEQDGLLVKPGCSADLANALARILADEAARQAMGRRGRAKVDARYGWEQIGARLESIYHQTLAEHESIPAVAESKE
jgi:glycosyltransferase involved in cell wall biosynthesis